MAFFLLCFTLYSSFFNFSLNMSLFNPFFFITFFISYFFYPTYLLLFLINGLTLLVHRHRFEPDNSRLRVLSLEPICYIKVLTWATTISTNL